MNIIKRVISWWQERGKTWTIEEDFGGPLDVFCPLGHFQIPGDFRYDRFTAVYNTPYPDMWEASAAHDWVCVKLREDGCVVDVNGEIIIRHRWEGDAVLMYLMLKAAERILVAGWNEANHALGANTRRRKLERVIDEVDGIMDRASIYHYGVRKYAKLFGLDGKRG